MKMKPEHFEALKTAILRAIETAPSLTEYQAKGLSAMRWRWDLLHHSHTPTGHLYSYLTDANIDTALRTITNTRD